MAVTVEELRATLRMEMKPFMRDLQQMNGVSAKAARQVEGTWRAANKRLDGIGKNMARSLIAPMAGIGAVLGTQELIRLTDTWTDLTSRVNLAAGSTEKGAEVMGRLGEMARRTYSDLEQTAESYLSNATALKELGYNTNQSLDYTEALNNALVVSGAKGQRAATVTDALAKAMALGKLSGQNLNTVISQGGRVAEALAAGLNTTVGNLRKMGSQGKITGNDLVKALSSQMEVLRKEAADMPATIGDGFTLLNNAMLEYVGNADHATGVSAKISEALVIMADNFDKTADVALQLAGVIAGALIGRSLLKMISTLGLAGSALLSFTRALTAARTMAGLATAFTGLSAAAGPVGLLIGGAVVSSLVLYRNATAEASEGSKLFAERLKQLEEAAKNSGQAVEEAGRKNDEYAQNSLTKEVEASVVALDDAREAAVNILSAFAQVSSMSLITEAQYSELARLRDGVNDGTISAEKARQSLYAMANADYNFQEVADAIGPILGKLALVSLAAKEAASDLAAITGARGLIEDRATRSATDPYIIQRQAGNEYEKEALRRASLGKSQLTLENEIAKVRNDALKEGITLTEKQIETIAKANIAGDAARSAEGKSPKAGKKAKAERDNDYERLSKQIADRTATMIVETETLRGLNPLIDDYGYALEKARAEQELLNAAQEAGVKITPELRAQIKQTAEQWALATVEANQLAEAQDELRQKSEEWRDTERGAFKGLVSDLAAGKSGVEALTDAVQKLIDKLLDMTLTNLFDGIFGKSGSLFGGVMGFNNGGVVKAATGGLIRGPGGPRTDSIPARLSDGEFVVNAAATKQNRALLEMINSGRSLSLAGGGMATLRPPSMPNLSQMGARQVQAPQPAPQININIASASGDDYIRAVVSDGVNQGLRQYDKSGPMRFARDSKQANRRGLVR